MHVVTSKKAALNSSGEVYVWGSFLAGNNMHKDKHLLGRKVLHLAASRTAFAAICEDGTITSWGENDRCNFFGIHPTDVEISCKVCAIQANDFAFAAILEDGSVVSWGTITHGADSEDIRDQLKNIQFIAQTAMAFCAVTRDGKVVTWGRQDEGGDSSGIQLSCLM
jgi:alpha-tubulin suppressor-like RCC1 family protein